MAYLATIVRDAIIDLKGLAGYFTTQLTDVEQQNKDLNWSVIDLSLFNSIFIAKQKQQLGVFTASVKSILPNTVHQPMAHYSS